MNQAVSPAAAHVDRVAVLRSAAADGSPEALFRLANTLLAEGRAEEALSLQARAATAGHGGAQTEYGRMRLFGIGAPANPQLALESLQGAERQRHPVAGYWLAWLALGSVLLPRDESINQRLLAAVNHEHPPALRAAALHFGRRPGISDQKACIRLLDRAARQGDMICALLLAERLQRGEGCPAQPQAAAALRAQLRAQAVEPLPPTMVSRLASHYDPPAQPDPLAIEEVLVPPPSRLLSEHPRVSQIDGLLSTDECRMLIALAMLSDPTHGAVVPTVRIDPAQEDFALRTIQLRLARAAHAELAQAELMQLERRVPGSPDWPHRDYLSPEALIHDLPAAGDRLRTLCVCLHPPEAGGGYAFPFGLLETRATAGSAMVVDNLTIDGRQDPYSMHASIAVERGEQWQAKLRLREQRYRPF